MDAESFALDMSEADASAWAGEAARAVAFCPGFFVTETGRVIHASKRRGVKLVKPWVGKRKSGSPQLTAVFRVFGCKQTAVAVSRLVCLAFNGSPPDAAHNNACHKDDNPANNTPGNLYWGTAKANNEDCLRNGRRSDGLTEADAIEVIRLAQEGMTVGDLTRRFGVQYVCIENLLRGKTWLHLPGERVLNRRVYALDVIREESLAGKSAREIALAHGFDVPLVQQMRSRLRKRGEIPAAEPIVRKPRTPRQYVPRITRVGGKNMCRACGQRGHNRATCTAQSAAAE